MTSITEQIYNTRMTATKITREFFDQAAVDKPGTFPISTINDIPDDDPVFDEILLVLEDGTNTLCPNLAELLEIFDIVEGEEITTMTPIKYKD